MVTVLPGVPGWGSFGCFGVILGGGEGKYKTKNKMKGIVRKGILKRFRVNVGVKYDILGMVLGGLLHRILEVLLPWH